MRPRGFLARFAAEHISVPIELRLTGIAAAGLPEVVIAGFGRFGQITGRLLAANRLKFTALDKNVEHVEFVKRFGNKVFYGDATRPELLAAAGLEVRLEATHVAEDVLALVGVAAARAAVERAEPVIERADAPERDEDG